MSLSLSMSLTVNIQLFISETYTQRSGTISDCTLLFYDHFAVDIWHCRFQTVALIPGNMVPLSIGTPHYRTSMECRGQTPSVSAVGGHITTFDGSTEEEYRCWTKESETQIT